MRQRNRLVGARFGRIVVLVVGVLGAFIAFDAILLVPILLLAAPSPYVGLLAFVGLPLAAVAGGALAWTAYRVWNAVTHVESEQETAVDVHEVHV